MFSGYGGLDLAVEQVMDAEPAWFVEYDAAPAKVLARHWPGIPNFGDVTQIDWEEMGRKPDLVGTQRMYDLYCQGMSLEQVAAREGVTRQTVYTRFKRRGLDLRPRKPALPSVMFQGRRYTIGVNGYYRATEGDRELLHRAVWKHHRGDIPDGWDVHHIDHDKTNNAVENLHCLSKADHAALHASERGDASDSRIDVLTAGYP
nr:HNH endonuclease [Corynebacterium sp. TAE3-ERU16]